MNKFFIILLASLLLWNCTEKQIALKYFDSEGLGVKMFGQNNQRSFSFNESLGDTLELLWRNETTGSYSNFSPIVFGDFLLVQDLSGAITSFNKNSGLLLGKNSFNGEIGTTPILRSFKIFFTLNYLRENYLVLQSFDLVRSKILSEAELPGTCLNEMVLNNEQLFLLTDEGKLYKFNDVAFQLGVLDTKTLSQSDLAADDTNLYWANQNGDIYSVKQSDLSINYQNKIAKAFETGFTIKGKFGYISDIEGNVYKINLHDGAVVWKYNTGSKIKCNVAVDDERIFVGNLAGDFYSINDNDGSLNYTIETGGILNSTPLVFNDFIVQPDLNERVYLIGKTDGKIKQEIEFERRVKMTPIYLDGIIYIGADRGQIYAFKPKGLSYE